MCFQQMNVVKHSALAFDGSAVAHFTTMRSSIKNVFTIGHLLKI